MKRRRIVLSLASGLGTIFALFGTRVLFLGLLFCTRSPRSEATRLGPAVDQMWEQLGGGPSDLIFPEQFLGLWKVQSTLVDAQAPYGDDLIPNMKVLYSHLHLPLPVPKVYERAKSELNQPMGYKARFIKNARGQIVLDRGYNTAALMGLYMSEDGAELKERIQWDSADPNSLRVSLPGGTSITTLATRRSQQNHLEEHRLETSEYFRMVFDEAGSLAEPRVTGQRCFTKYRWREEEEALRVEGPSIVATQIVSQYLAASDGREMEVLRTMGKAVIVYKYRMGFVRLSSL